MDSSFWFDKRNLGWSIVYIEGSQVIIYQKSCISFFVDSFVLVKSVDPDEMPHYAGFHLDLHCLPKNAFRSH